MVATRRVRAQPLEPGSDTQGDVGVERRRRLVEQQHVGRVEQGLGQRHAGTLTGRERAIAACPKILEGEDPRHLLEPFAPLPQTVEPGIDVQILAYREAMRSYTVLSDHAGRARTLRKLGALDAAAKVLAEAKEPMNCKDLIEAMAKKGYWTSPGGKTPHATLYAAMTKEIVTKRNESRFKKVARGQFALA